MRSRAHSARSIAEIELLYSGSSRSGGTEIVISNVEKLPAETALGNPDPAGGSTDDPKRYDEDHAGKEGS